MKDKYLFCIVFIFVLITAFLAGFNTGTRIERDRHEKFLIGVNDDLDRIKQLLTKCKNNISYKINNHQSESTILPSNVDLISSGGR
jgi:hypothetical protein